MSAHRKKVLKLPARLDTAAAGKLKRHLVSRRGSDLSIDAGAVVMLGTMCAEVLLSAAQLWRQEGRALTVASPSVSFSESLRLLGIASDLLPAKD